jgi:hypothetical protein
MLAGDACLGGLAHAISLYLECVVVTVEAIADDLAASNYPTGA